MMFGTREQFEYLECHSCGCLQIADVPADLSRHYPADYYSSEIESSFKIFLKSRRLRFDLGEMSLIGRYMSLRYGGDSCAKAIALGNVQRGDAILDVGGGAGTHLRPLRAAGFRHLLCVDPYVQHEVREPGLEIRRAQIAEVDGRFRLIMMHHSFEHMTQPHKVLATVAEKLDADGVLLVRIPVLGFGWRQYGANWIELDAPRHLYLHTRGSFELLANSHGFEVLDVTYDSTEMEIWGSEQYLRGIAHVATNSYGKNPAASIFSQEQIAEFRRQMREMNARGESGRAAFVLRRRSDRQQLSPPASSNLV